MSPQKSALSRYLKKALLVLAVVLCLVALLSALWTWGATRTHRFVYRLHPPMGQVSEARLQRTVDVLDARLRALGPELKLGRCSVGVLPPDRIELRVNCNSEPLVPVAWLTLQGRAEFRLLHPQDDILEQVGAEGLPPQYEVKVYRTKRYILTRLNELKTVEQSFAVDRKAALEIEEFEEVTFETVGVQKMVVLSFHFRQEDADAFGRLTALHAGRKMAMLIDGEMFFPPKEIESAITGGTVQAQGFFHIPPLRRLAKMLNCGSLPGALEEMSHTVD